MRPRTADFEENPMSAQELRACLMALRSLRAENPAPGARSRADIVEHVVLWGLASLVAEGDGEHAALAREVLEELAGEPVCAMPVSPCLPMRRGAL